MTSGDLPFSAPPGSIAGRGPRIRLGTGTPREDLAYQGPPGSIAGRGPRIRVGSGTAYGDLPFSAPPGSIAGRGPRIRVRGAGVTPAASCVDPFNRVVTEGWGTPPWCLPPWSAVAAARLSVLDGHGRIDNKQPSSPPYDTPRAWFDFDVGAAYPGTLTFRARRAGTAGEVLGADPGLPLRWWISPGTARIDGSAIWGFLDYTHDEWTGPYLDLIWWDTRPTPGGGSWSSDYTNENVDCTFVDLLDWWNVRVRIDTYGVYSRIWRDSESEHAHDAPTQPADVFGAGCPQGGGESWQIWEACDTELAEVIPNRFAVEAPGNTSGVIYTDVDDLGFEGGLCPCATLDRTVWGGWGSDTPTALPYSAPFGLGEVLWNQTRAGATAPLDAFGPTDTTVTWTYGSPLTPYGYYLLPHVFEIVESGEIIDDINDDAVVSSTVNRAQGGTTAGDYPSGATAELWRHHGSGSLVSGVVVLTVPSSGTCDIRWQIEIERNGEG